MTIVYKDSDMDLERWDEVFDAIEKGDLHKTYFLLKNEKDIDFEDECGRTFLMAAIYHGQLDIVKKIVKLGANIEKKSDGGLTAYLYACKTTDNIEIIKYLIDIGADMNAQNDYNDNALFIAAEYNKNLQIVEFLSKYYDVNSQGDIYNYTPLMVAARFNSIRIMRTLISKGADLFLKDKSGENALMHAAANADDNPTNLIALISLGSDILTENNNGEKVEDIAMINSNPNILDVCESLLHMIKNQSIKSTSNSI
jgi:ankyrin repeat protein